MTLAFDVPQALDAPLARMDPRWKLAALAPTAIVFALLRTLPAALTALLAALVLAQLARLPWPWLLRRLGWTAFFLAIFLVWLPLLPSPDAATWDVGPIHVSRHGLERFAVILVRTLAVVTVVLVVLATAPLHETLKAAQALHAPRILVQLLLMTTRYVFLLAEEFTRLRTALQVRGFRNRGNVHSWRTVGQVAGTLLVRGSERAERVAHAMSCRGFDGVYRSLHGFTTRWADVTALVGILVVAGALLGWDVWQR